MYRTDFWTLWERERVGWFGRMALKHVYYHVKRIASLCSIQDTGCLGLVHGDDLERWYGVGGGGGFRIGNSCTPVVDSHQCMAKPMQYCKVKWSKNKNFKKYILKKEIKDIINYIFLKNTLRYKLFNNKSKTNQEIGGYSNLKFLIKCELYEICDHWGG